MAVDRLHMPVFMLFMCSSWNDAADNNNNNNNNNNNMNCYVLII